MEQNKIEKEKEIEKLDKEEKKLNKKVEDLLDSLDYCDRLVKILREMFIEYEVYDNILCFSTLENNSDIINTTLDLNYFIKIIYNDNIFQFNAVDFKDKNTKFNVSIYNIKNKITNYTSNTFEDLKNDIIMWLITL